MLRFAIWIFLGYLVGAFFSEHIFIDLQLTHWSNLWVYFWLILWPLGAIVRIGLWAILAIIIVGGGYLLYQGFKEKFL